MTSPITLPSLSTARLIGLIGDTHGDLEHLLIVSQTMWERGVSALVVLGDFGFIWPRNNWSKDLDKLSKRLARRGQVLYWLDGNHEDFKSLYGKFPVAKDGLRRLQPNIIHLPRGYRAKLAYGRTLAVLGGANSIDAHRRGVGITWWVEEQITDHKLAKLGYEPAEVMLAYSAAGHQKFTEGFLQVRPCLYLGGHYHQYIDETVTYGENAAAFETRVILLGMNGSSTLSQAVLDIRKLEVEAFARNNATVNRLAGVESGLWEVKTRDSVHLFDLEARTVERRPGPNALLPNLKDMRPIRSIKVCEIGQRGFWTFPSDDPLVHYLWTSTSVIERIERLQPAQRTTQENSGQTNTGGDDD